MPSQVVAIVTYDCNITARLTSVLNRIGTQYRLINPSDDAPPCNISHVILSGGIYGGNIPEWISKSTTPVLGIGDGMVMIAKANRASVRKLSEREEGIKEITEIIDGNQNIVNRWMNREYRVLSVPINFTVTAVTSEGDIASFNNNKWWGVQYQADHNKYCDLKLFRRFLNIV